MRLKAVVGRAGVSRRGLCPRDNANRSRPNPRRQVGHVLLVLNLGIRANAESGSASEIIHAVVTEQRNLVAVRQGGLDGWQVRSRDNQIGCVGDSNRAIEPRLRLRTKTVGDVPLHLDGDSGQGRAGNIEPRNRDSVGPVRGSERDDTGIRQRCRAHPQHRSHDCKQNVFHTLASLTCHARVVNT